MIENITTKFKQALQQSEREHDPKCVAELFAAGAKLSNLGADHTEDATVFWQTYLDQFEKVSSEFVNEVIGENNAALEWRSNGKTKQGRDILYSGVSLISFNHDHLISFHTYYDSAAFVRNA